MPEKMITVREKKPVLCCTHCGRHPAMPVQLVHNPAMPVQLVHNPDDVRCEADLCAACRDRIEKMMQPIEHRPRALKPAAAPKPKPKRGRPRKLRMRMTVNESLDAAARIKAENDAMLGR